MTTNPGSEQSHFGRERESALEEAFHECSQANWDGYGAAPANQLAMEWASRVLAALPRRVGIPEIAFQPDGDAGLEWWRGPDRVLSISIIVGSNGELRYAARLSGERFVGTEVFAHGLPKRLVDTAHDLAE